MSAHNKASQSAELQQRLNEVVLQALDAANTPGAAVALIVDGQTILKAGIGFSNLQHNAALDPDALVYIYSRPTLPKRGGALRDQCCACQSRPALFGDADCLLSSGRPCRFHGFRARGWGKPGITRQPLNPGIIGTNRQLC